MKRKSNILAAFLIILIVLGALAGCSGETGTSSGKRGKDYSNIEMNPNISIPGYESLSFKAGTKKQSVNFHDPEENTCYFRISLVLEADEGTGADKAAGAEDTVLWTSELLEPGESVKSIRLERELESGDYPAVIKYECFSLRDNTPLNGANISVTLQVR